MDIKNIIQQEDRSHVRGTDWYTSMRGEIEYIQNVVGSGESTKR